MEAVGRRDEMASIATIVGGLGPGVLWLCQVVLAIERDLVAKTGRSQGEHHGPYTQEWIVITIENMLMLEPEPKVNHSSWGQAYQ